MNVDDGRRAKLTESDLGVMHGFTNGELENSLDDVRKGLKTVERRKSPGVDGITGEILKCGGECLFKWLRRACDVSMLEEKVLNDWMRAIITPIYKGKGDRSKCKNYKRNKSFEYTW